MLLHPFHSQCLADYLELSPCLTLVCAALWDVGYGLQIGAVFSNIVVPQAIGKSGTSQVIDLQLDNNHRNRAGYANTSLTIPSISKSTSLNLPLLLKTSLRQGRCFPRRAHQ